MEENMSAPKVMVFADAEEVARAAAECFVESSREAIRAAGRFSVALSGGSTPQRAYQLLASDPFKKRVDWTKTHIFFGDERCVPPSDADSNYRMADEALLARVPLPPQNIHRITGEGDAVAGARLYEDELQTFFAGSEWPRFDLVLLGMGDDGHTASLFPGTAALTEQRAWVAANWADKLNAYRITLTAPSINQAARVVFLVTGAGKAARLAEVIKGPREPARLPAQLIQPASGALEWFLDRAAASQLSQASFIDE
ncbi:MAG: 6-phosphogluconolactonase [Blastocatellia bacterium]|jgi:6-phosphogluconolactonase|nr:6-phosphogluconolactonase [Blastocatellia bacterium]